MQEIQIFQNKEFGRIRTVVIDGATWFCGKDVASALGYKDTKKAIARHCKERGTLKRPLLSNGGYQMSTFINEPNLYRLVTHSKLDGAKRFKRWVTSEVLPTIRKTGGYGYQKCIDCRIFEKLDDMNDNINYINANVNSLRTEIKDVPLTDCKLSSFPANLRRKYCSLNFSFKYIDKWKILL
ncbi:MAG: hypothetical protein K2I00_00845 [Ruminococcus sp.]|nr:hypothetical protein [Ruminococcus sp.]